MLINYFKHAVRLLIRNPFFTLINIICLSVGFAMFFILWQHSRNELDSDRFHKDYKRIVRGAVHWNWTDDGSNWQHANYGGLMARSSVKTMEDFGDFEESLEIYNQGNFESSIFGHKNDIFITRIDDKNETTRFAETNIAYADSNLFNFFAIPLIKGNASSVLGELRATVLSQSVARKYFGDVDPIGKILYLNDTLPLKVTGIFKDLPSHTHLNFTIVISTLHLGLEKINSYQLAHIYFKLKKGVDMAKLEAKLKHFTNVYFADLIKARNYKTRPELFLQPLEEVPFTLLTLDRFTAKSKHFLLILGVLSVVILGMAWVNFINLTLANNQKRMKELAARKAVGATSKDLIKQFMLESAVTNTISFVAALTLVQLLKYPAAILFQFHIQQLSEIDVSTWGILILVLLSGILISGIYPALITLTSTPKVLFGSSKKTNNRNALGKVLTTLQYASAIVLVAWVVSINLQLNFIFTKDIGINKEDIIVIDLPIKRDVNFKSSLRYFINRVESAPEIVSTTVSSSVVGDFYVSGVSLKQKSSSSETGTDSNGGVDEKFIPFFGIKLIAGRNFSGDIPTDKKSIIISKVATERMGFLKPEDALGVDLQNPEARVIGVIEDYAMRPLLSQYVSDIHGVRGITLVYGNTQQAHLGENKVSIKIKPGMITQGIAILKKEFGAAFPSSIFHWYFLDNHINQYYTGEKLFLQQILLFTGIAIGIACLGLLGMISNKVLESTKEIGIRKVLGAKMHQIAGVLLKTTAGQIAIATLLGLPIAYYLVQEYLQKFSERISLNWWHYLLPVFIFLIVMLATITSVLINAAKANPVESLRHE